MKRKEGRSISIFAKLFGKKSTVLPKAYAYVDFEHWYISMENMHKSRPDIKAWHDDIMKNYNIRSIVFFADFSNVKLKNEISNIRKVTNSIIDTQNNGHYKKDYTDFIMLDYIYQNAVDNSDIDAHIIFTGDGHFSSVANFLKNKLRKKVIIYGVSGAFSTRLKDVATNSVEVPFPTEKNKYYKMIVENFRLIGSQKNKRVIPTFMSTAERLAAQNGVSQDEVKKALSEMIEAGYIHKKDKRLARGQNVKILVADWKKINKDKIG